MRMWKLGMFVYMIGVIGVIIGFLSDYNKLMLVASAIEGLGMVFVISDMKLK